MINNIYILAPDKKQHGTILDEIVTGLKDQNLSPGK